MKQGVALLVTLAMTFCSARSTAQDIVLEHIPEGDLITVEGVEYMAYDLERFKSLARIDLQLTQALELTGLLEQKLKLKEERISILMERNWILRSHVQSTQKNLKDLREKLKKEPTWDWDVVLPVGICVFLSGVIVGGVISHASQ